MAEVTILQLNDYYCVLYVPDVSNLRSVVIWFPPRHVVTCEGH